MNNLLFVSNIHTIMDEFKNRILAEYRVELETVQDVSKSEKQDEVDILRKEKSVLERTIGELKIVLENVHQERDILHIENLELKNKMKGQENMIGNMNVIIQSLGQRVNGLTQLVAMYGQTPLGNPYMNYPPPAPPQDIYPPPGFEAHGQLYVPPPLPPVQVSQNNILSQGQDPNTLEQLMRSYQEKVAREMYQEKFHNGSKPDF